MRRYLDCGSSKNVDAGADMICNINASPFHRGKHNERIEAVRESVAASGSPIIYTNLCGGQDELIFDGRSFSLLIPAGNSRPKHQLIQRYLYNSR